jgi:predicted Fe-Mo cluster-binding NifX family protein
LINDDFIETDAVHRNGKLNAKIELDKLDGKEKESESVKQFKPRIVLDVMDAFQMEQVLIFCRTNLDCDLLEKFFRKAGNAGGMGIIETSSGELDIIKQEIKKMRELTDKPFGVNIAQAFVRDPSIAQFVIDQGVTFVTTSAGSPTKYTAQLKAAGLTVFHVVPTLKAALKAVDAGVDGLIVEGGEGGGFKNPNEVASMVLLPLVRSKRFLCLRVPVTSMVPRIIFFLHN